MNATDANFFFNESVLNQSLATIVNGTMTAGHFQVIAEVPGMDLLVSLVIVQTFFTIMMFAYMIFGRNLRRFKK
jgi:hypothetical protein